jgi:hypothetical protein
MVDDNEWEEEEEGDIAPARYPKRARSWSQILMGIFVVMLINNIHWYLVLQMKRFFCVVLMDSWYVVMQMNGPFFVTGESQ